MVFPSSYLLQTCKGEHAAGRDAGRWLYCKGSTYGSKNCAVRGKI